MDTPLYMKEFPDIDEAISVPPGMEDISWHNDSCPSFWNEATRVSFYVDYAETEKSEFPEWRKTGELKRYTLKRTEAGGYPLDEEPLADTDDFDKVLDAYARHWVRWVAAEGIGLGFHPDTKAASYSPPLEEPLASQYDTMLEFVSGRIDPYETAIDAWADKGLVSSDKGRLPPDAADTPKVRGR